MTDGEHPFVRRQFRPTKRFVVAAEIDAGHVPRAHAVGDVGALTPRHGIALCGLPVEELVIVPDLEWNQVEVSSRCRLCDGELSDGPPVPPA